MNTQKVSGIQVKKSWLFYYSVFNLVITLCFLFVALLNPSHSSRAILLGYSAARILIAMLLAAFALGFTILVLLSRDETRSEKIHNWLTKPVVYYHWLFLALLMFSVGIVILMSHLLDAGDVLTYYIQRLLPFVGWLVVSGIFSGVALAILRKKDSWTEIITISLLICVLVLGALIHVSLWTDSDVTTEDIYYMYMEGSRLRNGENPYERVLTGNMRENDKFATNFPVFYYFSAGTQALGLRDFPQWVSLWRIIFLASALVIAGVLTYVPGISGYAPLAILSPLFWLFNRWTLHVTLSADIEFLPLAILLLSILIVPKNKKEGFILFGLSLSIRQMGLFLIPMYIYWGWKTRTKNRAIVSIFVDIFYLAIIPLAASLPFLIWNSEGFAKSILFSATRYPVASADVLSLDALLGWFGIVAKIPMIIVLLLVYWLAVRSKMSPVATSFLVLLTFLALNSVIFTSYIVWVLPLVPLVINELLGRSVNSAELAQG